MTPEATLNQERYDRIMIDLAQLKDSDTANRRHIAKIREEFVRSETFVQAEQRIRSLENYKAQLFGMFVAAHVIGGIIATIVGWLASHK